MYEEKNLAEENFSRTATMPLGASGTEQKDSTFSNSNPLSPLSLAEGHSSINLNENVGGGLNCLTHKELSSSSNWVISPQDQIQGDDQQQLDHLQRNLLDLSILQNCSNSSFVSSLPFLNQGNIHSSSSSSSLGCFLGIDLHTSLENHHLLDPSSSVPYDPSLFPLNLPSQQDPSLMLRDLAFHPSIPNHQDSLVLSHGHRGVMTSSGLNSSLVFADNSGSSGMMTMMMDDHCGDMGGSHCQDGGEVFVFGCTGRGGRKDPMRCRKTYVTERERRITMKETFSHLRALIPNPSKDDRASIVGDAIEYIKELNRTVNELKTLVERKRCSRQKKLKRFKASGDGNNDDDDDQELFADNSSTLRSSWLHRKCRDTEVDVRIVDDEVTIKLVQRKRIVNCLLCVSRTLDELQLDLRHVAGGHVGDYCSFLFNSKISEGSSVYASAIANKLIEAVDQQYNSITSAS